VNEKNLNIIVDQKIHRSKKILFRTLNCCETQIINGLEVNELEDNELLRAATGLAGGIYNHGSTCGVILGVSLSYALQMEKKNKDIFLENEAILIYNIRKYIDFFNKTFNSTLCRERTELDFKTIKGKLGLLIPEKVKGCVKQTALSIKYYIENPIENNNENSKDCKFKYYCAKSVLSKVREETGIGSEHLEKLSVVFNGGIALTGNTCGALIGGMMALGLKYKLEDYNIKKAESFRNMFKAYPKPFRDAANKLVTSFENEFEGLECSAIINHDFKNICDFNDFYENNEKCKQIVNYVVKKTVSLLKIDS